MCRRYRALAMVAATVALTAAILLGNSGEEIASARVVRVERGEVRTVAALCGRLGYEESITANAQIPGRVAEVYVSPGQRVAKGQALMRLETEEAEQALSAWAERSGESLPPRDAQALLAASIIRAPSNATIRQLLASPMSQVAAGVPVTAMTAGEQVIRCVAMEVDGRQIRTGMAATLSVDGEAAGTAHVTKVGPVAADDATGRLVMEIALTPDAPLSLPVGASVEADVTLSGRGDVPVLPVEAVTARGTLWWVHDGICTEIPAEIVLSDEKHVWVALPEGVAVAIGEFTQGQRIREVGE